MWIAFASQVEGRITVDDGAHRALVEWNRSLLPAGVTGVMGDFDEGATVEICTADGAAFARGMVLLDSDQLRRVQGHKTVDLPVDVAHEVVHRDDLVVIA